MLAITGRVATSELRVLQRQSPLWGVGRIDLSTPASVVEWRSMTIHDVKDREGCSRVRSPLTLLLISVSCFNLQAQDIHSSADSSMSGADISPEASVRMFLHDPAGSCSPAALPASKPVIAISAESFAMFACDPVRSIWIATAAPSDTRASNVAVTEYGYVQGSNCEPTSNPGCNVISIAQLSGAGTLLKVQVTITPYNGSDLIGFECNGEPYPGENSTFSTFFMEAFQTTDWKTRNIGGNVAPDGFGSYRSLMIPFTTGCTVNVTNTSASTSEVFAQVEYARGTTPPSLTGGTRNHYHMAHDQVINIAPYAVHTCLNYSGSPGEIESVISSFIPEWNTASYLEGNPTFTTDSNVSFVYGGTEDFFGSQWYFQDFEDTSVSDEWGSPNVVQTAAAVQAFRFFTGPRETYAKVTWMNSVIFTQPNGASGQGEVEPAPLTHDCLVTFWTLK